MPQTQSWAADQMIDGIIQLQALLLANSVIPVQHISASTCMWAISRDFQKFLAAYRAQRDEAIVLSPGQKGEVAHNSGHMQKSA